MKKSGQKYVWSQIWPPTRPQLNNYRGVAQLVARDIWDVDAAGSNPVTPTNFPADLIYNVKSAGLF